MINTVSLITNGIDFSIHFYNSGMLKSIKLKNEIV